MGNFQCGFKFYSGNSKFEHFQGHKNRLQLTKHAPKRNVGIGTSKLHGKAKRILHQRMQWTIYGRLRSRMQERSARCSMGIQW